MLIRMLVQMPEGARRNGEAWPQQGVTTELPTAEAAHLIASGIAEEAPDEQAADPPRRARRKSAPPEE